MNVGGPMPQQTDQTFNSLFVGSVHLKTLKGKGGGLYIYIYIIQKVLKCFSHFQLLLRTLNKKTENLQNLFSKLFVKFIYFFNKTFQTQP